VNDHVNVIKREDDMTFKIKRIFENNELLIYKRLFNLTNCCGDKRYFVSYKDSRPANIQFRSISQVKKFIKSLEGGE